MNREIAGKAFSTKELEAIVDFTQGVLDVAITELDKRKGTESQVNKEKEVSKEIFAELLEIE